MKRATKNIKICFLNGAFMTLKKYNPLYVILLFNISRLECQSFLTNLNGSRIGQIWEVQAHEFGQPVIKINFRHTIQEIVFEYFNGNYLIWEIRTKQNWDIKARIFDLFFSWYLSIISALKRVVQGYNLCCTFFIFPSRRS